MQKFFGVAQDTAGNALAGATVTVKLAGTATNASIFSDNIYTVLANPFTANADGTYQFYAGNGRYDITVTKSGFSFPAAATSDVVSLDNSTIISPAQITASQNDYSPPNGLNAAIWRLNSSVAVNITGIVAGKSGQYFVLINIGVNNITLQNQNVGSAAANRIITGTGADVVLAGDASRTLFYDDATARWRIVS